MPNSYRGHVGRLWSEFRRAHPKRASDGQMFVKILDYVANHKSEFQPKRRFVKKWQHHYFAQANRLGNRNVQRGKLVYEEAGCARCHSISGQGAKYGPDLTDIGIRYQGRKLLDQVVKPSNEIHKDFQTQMFSVDDGRLLTGLVIEENEKQIKMLTNLLKPDKLITLEKSTVEKRKIAELSSMPTGLLDTFQQEEVLDLAGYLQSLKGAKQ